MVYIYFSSRREDNKKARFVDDPQDWQRYRKMVGKVLDDLDRIYEDFENEPESHPEYDVEWRLYWRRRSQELERGNKIIIFLIIAYQIWLINTFCIKIVIIFFVIEISAKIQAS